MNMENPDRTLDLSYIPNARVGWGCLEFIVNIFTHTFFIFIYYIIFSLLFFDAMRYWNPPTCRTPHR
jgi:hypothetical protein